MSNTDIYGNEKPKPMNFDWLSNTAKSNFDGDVINSIVRIIDDTISYGAL